MRVTAPGSGGNTPWPPLGPEPSRHHVPNGGALSMVALESPAVTISVNGDRCDLDGPLTVAELLVRLAIDSGRVAVEHNDVVVKRSAFAATLIADGDHVEIVNFVGGG